MPIYEYHCTQCGTDFEVIQSFRDKPLKNHRTIINGKYCKGKLEKLVSLPGTPHFAGGGWAADGYRKAYVDSKVEVVKGKNNAGE